MELPSWHAVRQIKHRFILSLLTTGIMLASLAGMAMLLAGCRPAESAAPPSELEAFRPLLQSWEPEEVRFWEGLPRYAITATLNVAERTLQGKMHLRFTNREQNPMYELYFRLYPNLPQYGGALRVAGVWSAGSPLPFEYDRADTALKIPCTPPMNPGQWADLDIAFHLTWPAVDEGWVLFGESAGFLSLPYFYPTLAVHNGQGWHLDIPPAFADASFSEAAFYDVWLTLPTSLPLAGTGMQVEERLQEGGIKQVHWRAGPVREFVVLGHARYQELTREACGSRIHSYFLPEDRAAGQSALDYAASALCVYSDAYGPYPFTVMTVAEAPLTYHGMEFSGLNLLGMDTYRSHRDELGYLAVHEVAHQWWYAQVGNGPYNCAWLDEGLAEYSSYTYYARVYGREEAERLRVLRWEGPYTYARAQGQDKVLAQPADQFLSQRLYESMVYAKAALFFDALRRAVGDDLYYAILQEYVRRFRFRIASPADFFEVAGEVSGRDLTPLIQQWVLTAEGTAP